MMWGLFERLQFNTNINGMSCGSLVRHKVSKRTMVVRAFYVKRSGEWWAVVSTDVYADDEIRAPVLELEPVVITSDDQTDEERT